MVAKTTKKSGTSTKSIPELEASSDNESSSSSSSSSSSEVSSPSPHQEESTESSGIGEDPAVPSLNALLDVIEEPETLLHTLLTPSSPQDDDDDDDDNDGPSSRIQTLKEISQSLFRRMEQLGHLQEKLLNLNNNNNNNDDDGEKEDSDEDGMEVGNLSGLTELYLGEGDGGGVDAETVWGQVDLQNEALLPRLKKIVRRLEKGVSREKESGGDGFLRLLDMGMLGLEDAGVSDDDDDDGDDGDSEGESGTDHDDDEEEDEDEDEEAKRIRERMERTMADMDNPSSSSDNDSDGDDPQQSSSDPPQSSAGTTPDAAADDLPDPAREELNDGFFDLHEMEAFADEEEEMLPDITTFDDADDGAAKKKRKKKTTLPHLRARMGNDDDDDDDDDDDEYDDDDGDDHEEDGDLDDLTRKVVPKGRTRFRDDNDIDALGTLYHNKPNQNDNDDDAAANISASDFFGQPRKASREYLRKLQKEKEEEAATKSKKLDRRVSFAADDGDDEVDSWDGHNFAEEGEDWRGSKDTDSKEMSARPLEDDDGDDDNGDGDGDGDEPTQTITTTTITTTTITTEPQTTHAKSSQKLEELTTRLEQEAIAEKPWHMIGEAKSSQRPVDSLLDSTACEFEFATKMAPIITVEHTASIEDMIKARILADDFDDVIPRELPDIGIAARNKELPEVSQEKSKLSLGELYEREYLKKATGYDADAAERQTEEEKAKSEIKMLFANLCSKLDALSNYQFAPRPVAEEADVKTSATPAIAMEEVLPLHVSGEMAKAPEEIYGKKDGREGVIRTESEMDKTDRTRLRQAKKAARRKSRRQKHADEKLISRLQPGLGLNNPYEKRKMREELQAARASGKVVTGEIDADTDFKTSARFFEKMQADVENVVQGDGEEASGNGGRKRKRGGGVEGQKSSVYKL